MGDNCVEDRKRQKDMKIKRGRKPLTGKAMRRKISVRVSDAGYFALRARAGKSSVAELVRQRVTDLMRI